MRNVIQILYPNGEAATYTESEIKSLWENEMLDPKTVYKSAIMTEWAPLAQLLNPQRKSTPLPPPLPVSSERRSSSGRMTFHFEKKPFWTLGILAIMLVINAFAEFWLLLANFEFLEYLGTSGLTQEEALAGTAPLQVYNIISVIILLTTMIVFARWLYIVNTNCHGFGAACMRFSPGWAVGWYFIPFLCYFKPYLSMKEMWKVSQNPYKWENEKTGFLLPVWWFLWITSAILDHFLSSMALSAKTIPQLRTLSNVEIFANGIGIQLSIAALLVVFTLTRKQHKLVRKGLHSLF